MRILLCSDLHLGMKFAGYPDVQEKLVEARFACLERVVAEANDSRCDLLVIAGDLFERVRVVSRDIERAAAALRGFQGRLAVVMPGNHDYVAPDDELWPRFADACGDTALVLDQPRPYPLEHFDLDACLYPGPCTSKHADVNAIGWVRAASRDPAVRHRIGIAHGSVEGFSPDFDGRYYPMSMRELTEAGIHLWLLGHTHVRFPAAPGARDTVFCAGTPEPDGFDCRHEGSAWLLELDEKNAVSARAVRTGAIRFREESVDVRQASDLVKAVRLSEDPEAARCVLRLHLKGSVSRETRESLGAMRARMAPSFLHLDLRSDELREEITREAIDRAYPVGSIPHSLLVRLAERGDQEALEAAHELLSEMRA
jgi:DNA repair exonuclease SbcCD nuclease subunit